MHGTSTWPILDVFLSAGCFEIPFNLSALGQIININVNIIYIQYIQYIIYLEQQRKEFLSLYLEHFMHVWTETCIFLHR